MSERECTIGTCAYERQCVAGWGPLPAEIVLVGEAPGKQELSEGRPFIGRSGQLLDRLLDRVGLDRAAIRITNRTGCVVLEREDRRPLPEEIAACEPRLLRELALAHPRVILCMGNTAMSLFWPGERIGTVYNQVRSLPDGTMVLASYRPAAALRNPHLVPVIEEGLRIVRSLAYPSCAVDQTSTSGP